ncbi:MAG: zinc-dependent alcohol dehydrogenase family protein [Alphaproteobacteria bacterium]
MRAMTLERPGEPLTLVQRPVPRPGPGQLLIRVRTCAVCRTDLHVVDGDLPHPNLPVVPGHEIIGVVDRAAEDVRGFAPGERVGVPWLGWTCGECRFCRSARENLCAQARFTGYTLDGGFADYAVADHRYCFRIPETYSDMNAAPLMCAGLIGHRSYKKAGPGVKLGLYGFGAAAHIIAQVARHEGRQVYAFTKPGDVRAQRFARSLGAVWAGGSDERPPETLDAAILFAPVGALVPAALKAVDKGGRVICAGIHMSDIPAFPYGILWEERSISSVANLTRQDGLDFLAIAARTPLETTTHEYRLEEANRALEDLREGRFEGAAVIRVSEGPPARASEALSGL